MKKILNHLFGEPAAQRERDRERRNLVHELDRVPYVMARLAELDKLDSEAMLAASRATAAPCCAEPVRVIHPTCQVSA